LHGPTILARIIHGFHIAKARRARSLRPPSFVDILSGGPAPDSSRQCRWSPSSVSVSPRQRSVFTRNIRLRHPTTSNQGQNMGPVAAICCTVPHGPTRHPPAGTTGEETRSLGPPDGGLGDVALGYSFQCRLRRADTGRDAFRPWKRPERLATAGSPAEANRTESPGSVLCLSPQRSRGTDCMRSDCYGVRPQR